MSHCWGSTSRGASILSALVLVALLIGLASVVDSAASTYQHPVYGQLAASAVTEQCQAGQEYSVDLNSGSPQVEDTGTKVDCSKEENKSNPMCSGGKGQGMGLGEYKDLSGAEHQFVCYPGDDLAKTAMDNRAAPEQLQIMYGPDWLQKAQTGAINPMKDGVMPAVDYAQYTTNINGVNAINAFSPPSDSYHAGFQPAASQPATDLGSVSPDTVNYGPPQTDAFGTFSGSDLPPAQSTAPPSSPSFWDTMGTYYMDPNVTSALGGGAAPNVDTTNYGPPMTDAFGTFSGSDLPAAQTTGFDNPDTVSPSGPAAQAGTTGSFWSTTWDTVKGWGSSFLGGTGDSATPLDLGAVPSAGPSQDEGLAWSPPGYQYGPGDGNNPGDGQNPGDQPPGQQPGGQPPPGQQPSGQPPGQQPPNQQPGGQPPGGQSPGGGGGGGSGGGGAPQMPQIPQQPPQNPFNNPYNQTCGQFGVSYDMYGHACNASCSISASPVTVSSGQQTTLTWSSQGASSASISNLGSVNPNGSQLVTPSATTQYAMTVYGYYGSGSSCSATVTVNGSGSGGVPTANITCSPQTADVGSTIALSYSCGNSTTSSGSGFSTNGQTSGSASTTLAAPPQGTNTATYSLTCTNAAGQSASGKCSVQVAVSNIVMVANPSTISSGHIAQIGWVTTGMQSCVVSSPQDSVFTAQNAAFTNTSGTAQTSALTSSADYVLTCTTVGGNTKTAQTAVTVQ